MTRRLSLFSIACFSIATAVAQQKQHTPAQAISAHFAGVNRQVLAMAQDFPADKYNYRPNKDVRTFGEVIVHIASGNVYGAKKGKGENVKWDEIDPKNYKSKDEIVALLQKSIADGSATLKETPEDRFTKSLDPWLDIIEHAGEHYGQLVVYYRNNGMVPPASRPK